MIGKEVKGEMRVLKDKTKNLEDTILFCEHTHTHTHTQPSIKKTKTKKQKQKTCLLH